MSEVKNLDPDDIELRALVAESIMDRFHSVPKGGHFNFDWIDAQELLNDIKEHLEAGKNGIEDNE